MQTTIQLLRAQIPQGTPNPGENTSIDISRPFDLIVYIILPILLIVVLLVWRQKKRKK
ncbi:adenylosuccinate synthetase [Winogradskyella costae]|uniref:adenylosuccinate synthetase n=1 Tax=Winogradskyella costae TaxID=2697008 RepID=UPI0015CA73DE|nr:adenylosuccinate synthetase [Winogradskyella costae]